jgi:Ca2+-binding RTX toxin-like protein
VPQGLVIETSEGETSLVVTRIEDRTSIAANSDGVTILEDIEALIPIADLLQNDALGGRRGQALSVTGVGNFTHGTGFLDANGFVHFTPDADYFGPAGFTYQIHAPTGQTATAVVDLTIQNVNDAPTALLDQHIRPVYGYDDWGSTVGTYVGPHYEPYFGFNAYGRPRPNNDDGFPFFFRPPTQNNTIITHVDIDGWNVASVDVTDIDDPNGPFTYSVFQQPQAGEGTVSADGTVNYINWFAPGRPGTQPDGGGLFEQPFTFSERPDPFIVRVSDAHGAHADVTMTSVHVGLYNPNLGGGGGKKPISVDLEGNGFDFTDVDDSNVFFDINSDGWKRRMAWPGAGDGLLAFDADRNGKITDGDEISFQKYLQGARSDLEGLRAFDTDEDGVFTEGDAAWYKFGIWRDVNQNGVTDDGEFASLDELGAVSVNLTSDEQFQVIDGQTVNGIGSMLLADGRTLSIADVTLSVSDEVLITRPDGSTQIVRQLPFGGADTLTGTDGKDFIPGRTGSNQIDALGGDDVVIEDAGEDVIDAGDGNDVVFAGADNDIVMARAGDDAVFGGDAHDLLLGDAGQDALFGEAGNDLLFGGEGNDLVNGGAGNDVLAGDEGEDEVYGESGRDVLFGGAGDDVLAGMSGNDILYGDAGADTLDGGEGDDEMHGGTGDDTYVVDSDEDEVIELAGEGRDVVKASVDYMLAETLEELTLVGSEDLEGHGNQGDNIIIGNSGRNSLFGGAGNDTVKGGAGADALVAGEGDDTYVVDDTGDTVTEHAGEGSDIVYSSVTYAAAAEVENLTLTGFRDIDGLGNAAANVLTGNSARNRLDGAEGADLLQGGAGDDSYVVDHADDALVELAGEGADTAYSSISYVTPLEVEKLVLTGGADLNATGNHQANTLVGNSGANRLDGASGADVLTGGAGDDTYVLDDAGDEVVEAASEGLDVVESSVSFALTANVENGYLKGAGSIDAVGNNHANVLVGNEASNRLDGGAGADRLEGNAGDDSYIVDDEADVVVELAGGGEDTVYSSVTNAAAQEIENLTLMGDADLNATGNALSNVLTGNSGANRLDGAAGGDRLMGGEGDDAYLVDDVADQIIEAAGEGIDTVYSSVAYTAAEGVDNITLVGVDDLSATGNALDNILEGNSGRNALAGRAGDDTYFVDHAGDAVFENEDEGEDSVYSSVSYSTAAHVENLTLTGIADIDATGNGAGNTLVGNNGANRLDGGAGVDVLKGSAGDDSYIVDHVGDAVVEFADEGVDSVYSSVSYVTPLEIEKLVLTGLLDIDATGNEQVNILVGNDGANRLDGRAAGDLMIGGAGDDTYLIEDAADTVVEWNGQGHDTALAVVTHTLAEHVEDLRLSGSDAIDGLGNALDNNISGNAAANVLSGSAGRDRLSGGEGDDTYLYRVSDGLDDIQDSAGTDTVRFGEGLSLDNVSLRIRQVDGVDVAAVRILDANGCEQADQGFDFSLLRDATGQLQSPIESFVFSGGMAANWEDLLIRPQVTFGSRDAKSIVTGRNDDTIFGWVFSEEIHAGSGNDIIFADNGGDRAFGEGGDDYLSGGLHDDVLDGGYGTDVLTGSMGEDLLVARGPQAAADGGKGRDVLRLEGAASFLAGGTDDDLIQTSAAVNVLAYNVGDGHDVVSARAHAITTLSLGGQVDMKKLSFERAGNDLLFNISSSGSITFQGWYADPSNRNVSTLQVFSRTNGNHASDLAVESYDFRRLVETFDGALAGSARVSRWSLTNALLDSHLGSNSTGAIGGDLSVAYASHGALGGMPLPSAQAILKDGAFGLTAQAFSAFGGGIHPGERIRD